MATLTINAGAGAEVILRGCLAGRIKDGRVSANSAWIRTSKCLTPVQRRFGQINTDSGFRSRGVAGSRSNKGSAGAPTSVLVRVAHGLLRAGHRYLDVRIVSQCLGVKIPLKTHYCNVNLLKRIVSSPRCSGTSSSNETKNDSSGKDDASFGYTRKDVLLIGLGVTAFGVGLKSGLEFFGVDPLQAGNIVQLLVVLGLTVGWISTYMFRVANKDMTYAQQLRDYENKVMQKRLEGLTEAELEALLEQVEEEKRCLSSD